MTNILLFMILGALIGPTLAPVIEVVWIPFLVIVCVIAGLNMLVGALDARADKTAADKRAREGQEWIERLEYQDRKELVRVTDRLENHAYKFGGRPEDVSLKAELEAALASGPYIYNPPLRKAEL